MKYIFKACQIYSVLSVHALMNLKILACLVKEKNKYKAFACFFENTYMYYL
jgi:hypothetical protein